MILLEEIGVKENFESGEYPFNLPLFKEFNKLKFENPVTFLVGENGSGKSTILEAIAAGAGLPSAGENRTKVASEGWKLAWKLNRHKGFFIRAEDFFAFVSRITTLKTEMHQQKTEAQQKYTGYGQILAVGSAQSQLDQLEKRYGNLDELSHGEGFLQFFMSRIVPGGLYLMDEPEAALSPKRQMSLISLITKMVQDNCQFIIATHSPILMAISGATIYSFDQSPPKKVIYSEVEHVTLTKSFLGNPEAYLRQL